MYFIVLDFQRDRRALSPLLLVCKMPLSRRLLQYLIVCAMCRLKIKTKKCAIFLLL